MDAAALLTALAVLILVILFLAQPLLDRRPSAPRRAAGVSSLEGELDRTIETLRELDFDRALGKIPDDEYPARRQELMALGADLLRRMDDTRGPVVAPAGQKARAIESEIAARRRPAAEAREAELEAEIAARRWQTPAKSASRKAGFCPSCGSHVQVGDKYCPSCGRTLRHDKTT